MATWVKGGGAAAAAAGGGFRVAPRMFGRATPGWQAPRSATATATSYQAPEGPYVLLVPPRLARPYGAGPRP